MKLFQRIMLLALLVMVGSVEVKAADPVLLKLDYVRKIKLTYQSVDVNNNPVTLSEMVYVNRYYNEIKTVFISNHPTTTDDSLVPTGSAPQIEQIAFMCDGEDKALVIAPDYQGYGTNISYTHPYMCSTMTARNVVDGVIAAMNYIVTVNSEYKYIPFISGTRNTDPYYFSSSYFTLNTGYSQGGAATLAVHKYLETEASAEVKDKIKLKKSICGAGPHKQSYMFDVMEPQEDLFYSLYIPYTIEGMRAIYANSTMRGLTDEEIYTEKFLASDIRQKLLDKSMVAADLNNYIREQIGTNGNISFYDIIRPEYRDHSSKLYRTLRKALLQQDLLDGWKPTLPIDFYHFKGDKVVPYQESLDAYNHFKDLGCNVNMLDAEQVGDPGGIWSLSDIVTGDVPEDHMGYGTRFYIAIFAGKIR